MYAKTLKRLLDVVLAALALAVLAVPMLLTALVIKLDSKGPVLFKQKRVGLRKQYFTIYKFRTMRTDAPSETPTHMLTGSNSYITRVGRYLRISSADELPQLVNILKGDMSFVGPRPALWNQFDLIEERDRLNAHAVRPGLTGLAQVRGRDELDIAEKAMYDGIYVRNVSFEYDLRILLQTVIAVIYAEGYREGGVPPRTRRAAKVSVIVSTYRRDGELRRALRSIRQQTYQNLQIIVGDDNADPAWNARVEEIAREFGALHVVNPRNLGSARNRNRAAEFAEGEYIAFLDDDDVYRKQKIENQLKTIQSADADVCIEDLKLVDEKNRPVETRTRKYLINARAESYLGLHLIHHMSGTDSLMFRKAAFDRIGGFPPIDLGDEFYLMAKALSSGLTLCYHPEVGVVATVHNSGSLSSGESKIRCENDLYAYKKQFFSRLTLREKGQIRMRHHAVLAFAYLRMRSWGGFAGHAALSFVYAPIACVKLFLKTLLERSR